jgi:HlyD family secretion protein
VATARIGDLRTPLATNGKVEPQRNYEAHAPFAGVVSQVYVHEGEQVPAGKLLLRMDDTSAKAQVANALAALRGAEASYQAALHGGTPAQRISLESNLQKARLARKQAEQDLKALENLEKSGAASPSEVASAQNQLAADNNTLQALQQQQQNVYAGPDIAHAKAALNDAKAAYAAAEAQLSQAIVRAPFAGTVYSLPVLATDYVQQGDRLLSIADLSHLQVTAYFDEPQVGKLQLGQPATVVWDAHPNQSFHGHIVRLPSTITTYGTRNVGAALVSIEDQDGDLLPDTNVRVTVITANESNVLVVPRDALHIEQGSTYVYRVAGGTLHRTPVTIGNLNLVEVRIVSGLKAGDVVATGTTNGLPMNDGDPIRIVR